MHRLQVIVTSMHQNDFSLIKKMNLEGKVLVANQTEKYDYDRYEDDKIKAEMLSTPTRGLAKNRNIGLMFADETAEYIMFADDDMVLVDGYENYVLDEFERHPEAEALKFNLYNISKTRKISMKDIGKFHKATRKNISSSGVCGLAVRQDVLKRHNMKFNENFGAGTSNYCGEDTIFLQELITRKVALYLSPIVVAGIDQSETTWFEGYNQKYFTVIGKVLATVFLEFSYILAVRSAYKFSKRSKCDMKFFDILKAYNCGICEQLREKRKKGCLK